MCFLCSSTICAQTPEEKAVAYLSIEVPRWVAENHCYSCHNNGDGARALFAARQLSYKVPAEALRETISWITDPGEWDNNHGDAGFSDKKLERIQFAASLVEAFDAGLAERSSLLKAAEVLLRFQDPDGSWQVRSESIVGTPATYGPILATAMARRTLAKADEIKFSKAIRAADEWMMRAGIRNVVDAAALSLALGEKRRDALEFLTRAQGTSGGWGPFANSPPEAFDTAIALLALAPFRNEREIAERIRRSREFLASIQYADGGWPETTRPAGGKSYAQHISTTGWATLAMLGTR